MTGWTRRQMLGASALRIGAAGLIPAIGPESANGQEPGDRPAKAEGVTVLNPRGRVPVGLIVDDSTCLVNLAHFAIPQFAEVFPDQYKQPWKTLPREIPDAFVRKFGEWCHEHGVRGKYSIVPAPACVGWVDRDLPGWSKAELNASLDLVRTLMMPDWDIHPEMVTHTWVIETKTGRPYPERTEKFMENWGWSAGRSADELADYLGYALRILKNAGLPCEGITTPGGFGNRALESLSRATLESARDVFAAEIPHYFRHVFTDDRSVLPRVELASGLDGPAPKCVVSIIGGTGDWFGGWDGLTPGSADQFLTEDGRRGRLADLIARGEPAILVGHWPGFYFNGEEVGFTIFKEVVRRLSAHFDNLLWMKLSEIARYWAARELTTIRYPNYRKFTDDPYVAFQAPFACPGFTVRIDGHDYGLGMTLSGGRGPSHLDKVERRGDLRPGTWTRIDGGKIACFDLPKGGSRLTW